MSKEETQDWTVRAALCVAAQRLRQREGINANRHAASSLEHSSWDVCAPRERTSSDNADSAVASSEAATLLAALMQVEKTQLALMQEEQLSPELRTSFERAVARRVSGEPLQYIVGEAPFRHLMVKATPAALIPRPETEVLVEVGLQHLLEGKQGEELRLADVGTGTGNIALSLMQELWDRGQAPTVYASDISAAALALALENASCLMKSTASASASREDSLVILESNLLTAYPQEFRGTFDAIFSNPPYLSDEIMQTHLPQEVKDYEPALALAGGADGLNIFRRLQSQAPAWLKRGGWLFVELGEDNVEMAACLLGQAGCWQEVSVTKDLTNRPRVLSARLTVVAPDRQAQ